MGAELRPLGVNCNITCQYCYQNPQRDAGNLTRSYDMEAMKSALARERDGFTLFGGEPLLLPKEDLRELWAWGLERFGYNSLQTNGTLITETYIQMFREYRVHVGISIDGPGELNDVRWAGSLEKTREATEKTHTAIERLCKEGMPPSLIVTLHRNNATADKLPVMHDWFRYLESLGVMRARLHVLEVENELIRSKYALPMHENIKALLSFVELESELKSLRFDIFQDMESLMTGQDSRASCVWRACDPYTTEAVRGIEGNGQTSNCGRTNKEGIDFTKAEMPGFERYVALYYTPQEHGGCKGCRFFLMCKGQCPGTAIDGDWRNRTEHCEVWKTLFTHIEKRLVEKEIAPISRLPIRNDLEAAMVKAWASGTNPLMHDLLQVLKTL
ncbi:MAG: radical SAM protein [Blastocatellia bacterium]